MEGKQCWHYEGGRCYLQPCMRYNSGSAKGLSMKWCYDVCEHLISKRNAISKLVPNNKLVIFSEIKDGE